MRHGYLRKIAMALAGLAAATAVVELGFAVAVATPLRWILPVPSVALYGPDPATGFRHRANVRGMLTSEHRNFVTTSNLGLRDRNRSAAHGAGPRAVIVGNSYVEALQVDLPQTATAIAEDILARQRPGAEVINLGLAGASPAVMVARLGSQGLALSPDAAVVLVQYEDFSGHADDNDLDFPSYRPSADGDLRLSFGFRETPGYRFRTSAAGRLVYWLMDHSQIARIVNGRKNSGLLAEWPQSGAGAPAAELVGPCPPNLLDKDLALWSDGQPAKLRAIVAAFLRDLAAIRRERNVPIIVATRGIEVGCPALAARRTAVIDAARALVESAGLRYVDLDARAAAKVGPDGVARLLGFGALLGSVGHLNLEGNRIYGEIFAEIIAEALPR